MGIFITLLNRIINFLKYPIAILFFLLTIQIFFILFSITDKILSHHYDNYIALYQGVGLYILIYFFIFRKMAGSWFFILEHELTHTLFALLTLHKIHDFRVHSHFGGFVAYDVRDSGGNWLITIAPYFFPTLSMIIIGFIHLSQPQYYTPLIMLLGYSMAYHIHSTIYEVSSNQPDIAKVGKFFAWLFLPSANMLAIIGILASIPDDKIKFLPILEHLYNLVLKHIETYLSIIEKILSHFS